MIITKCGIWKIRQISEYDKKETKKKKKETDSDIGINLVVASREGHHGDRGLRVTGYSV